MKIAKYAIIASLFVPIQMKTDETIKHIRIANHCVNDLKRCIIQFLDKKSKLTIADHTRRLKTMIGKLETLEHSVKNSYEKENSRKYLLLLKILKKLKKSAKEIHGVVSRSYYFFLSFSMALYRVISKITSEKFTKKIIDKVDKFKSALNAKEQAELDALVNKLFSIKKLVPDSKVKLIATLYTVWSK